MAHPVTLKRRIEVLGLINDPHVGFLFKVACSPTSAAQRFQELLHRRLERAELRLSLDDDRTFRPDPALGPDNAIFLGLHRPDGARIYLDVGSILRHILIVGGSGSGKTIAGDQIVMELVRLGIRVSFVEGKFSEGRRLVLEFPSGKVVVFGVGQEPVNLVNPPSPDHYQRYFARLFDAAAGMQGGRIDARMKGVSILERIWNGRRDTDSFVSIAEVLDIMRALTEDGEKPGQALSFLSTVCSLLGEQARVRRSSPKIHEIPLTVYEWAGLQDGDIRFLTTLLVERLFAELGAAGESGKLNSCIFFDEGRSVFGREQAMTSRLGFETHLYTKARSFGVCLVLATQSVREIQEVVIANSATVLILSQSSEKEAKACCGLLGWKEERFMELMHLDPGNGFLKAPGIPEVLPIRVHKGLKNDAYPSDRELEELMRPIHRQLWEAAELSKASSPGPPIDAASLLHDKKADQGGQPKGAPPVIEATAGGGPIDEVWYDFLGAVERVGSSGVVKTYEVTGVSRRKGTRLKELFLGNELIEVSRQKSPTGGRPIEALSLTTKGKQFLESHKK